MSTEKNGGGFGCAAIFDGIFSVVGVILGAVGVFAGDTTSYDVNTGQHTEVGTEPSGTLQSHVPYYGARGA